MFAVLYFMRGELVEKIFDDFSEMLEWCGKRGLLNGKRKIEIRHKVGNCWKLVNVAR